MGISQAKLAEELGVTQQTIYKYENSLAQPDIDMLRSLADFFETSIDYLVGHTDIRNKIEKVQPFDLNSAETGLLEKYRRLPVKYRSSVESLMDDFLSK